MARMIPAAISPKVKSQAERKIYEWFKNDPMTKDWVVFHSLGIENHQTVIFGEIDFLVAASNEGVFALEVKGGRISRKDGVWVYTDKYGVEHEKVRGPFEQASEGMYSVIETLKGAQKHIGNTLCGYGAMFPDVEYNNEDIDISQDQIFDKRDKSFVGRYIKRLAEYSKNKYKSKKVFVVYPSEDDINEIVNTLRKDFDKAVPLSTKIEYAENTLIELTAEQYRCIDGLSYNKRCLINGPAGTGKTILAIKNAKESVANGKKVGFFCFNTLLAKELKKHFEGSNIMPEYVGSFTRFIQDLVEEETPIDFSKIEDLSAFYREELPALALDALSKRSIKFDKIIIDEAQDLMNENYLLVLDALLEGGLKRGEWFFFGDFDIQTIYNRGITYDKTIEMLENEASFAVFGLTVNCRNTQNIQKEMNFIAGVSNESLHKDNSMPQVKYITYESEEEELELLENELSMLVASGIERKNITLLSPFKFEKSIASKITKFKVLKCAEDDGKSITYSTIQGFKGLENSVIILTDIQTYNKPDLMYVAMSRPRSALYIFETKHAKKYRGSIER